MYHAIKWIVVAWSSVEPLTIQKCFKRCGILNFEADDALQDVDVFENLDALAPVVRDELTLVTAEEFIDFEKDVQCCEASGNTPDEIGTLLIAETVNQDAGPSTAPPPDDEQVDEEEFEKEIADSLRHKRSKMIQPTLESFLAK